MDSINTLGHTLLAIYVLATVGWLVWCQLRRRAAFEVVVGDSWLMLALAFAMAPVICLIILKVYAWQSRQQ